MTRQSPQFSEAPLPLFGEDEVQIVPALPAGTRPSYIRDHRKRLRARFLDGGAAMPCRITRCWNWFCSAPSPDAM